MIGDDSVEFEDEFMYFSAKVAACTSVIREDSNVLQLAEKCWRNDDDFFQIISSVGSGGNAPPIVSDKSEVKVKGLGIFQNQDSAEDERITIYLLVNWVLPQHFPLFSLGSATSFIYQ